MAISWRVRSDMENATILLRGRWIRRYLLRIVFYSVAIFSLLLIGRIICFAIHPIWHWSDPFYGVLNFVDDNTALTGVLVLVVVIMISTITELSHISNVIGQITESVGTICNGKDEDIRLPKDFREIEVGLKKIQFDNRISENAAKEANQRKNDMIMYMAHDLKTPLTSVIGYLSLLNDEKELPEHVKEKYVGIALKKSFRLEELINGFFDIARFNFTQMVLEKETVNMSVMLSQIVTEFEPIFREKGLECELAVSEDVRVTCDIEKMERVYDNLFKNIANYSYPNTKIAVSLTKNGDSGMILTTVNKGKTIPKEMLPHIFEQFFRIDSARSSESGGSGLGLAVVKEIVEQHGGTVCCSSENEEIVFKVILP